MNWPRAATLALIALVLLGASVRVAYWAMQRPVWVDEAGLALNVVGVPWSALTGPLDRCYEYHAPTSLADVGMRAKQTTPLAYLAALKLSANLGHGEPQALRLPGLVSALLWLVALAWWAMRRPPVEGLAICAAIACSRFLIEHSIEIKQYSWEGAVAFALLAVLLSAPRPERWSVRRTLGVALAGAVAVWCAFGSVLVLAGCGVVFAGRALLRRDGRSLARLTCVGAAWLASFGLYYLLLLRENFALQADAFAMLYGPDRLLSGAMVKWLRDALLGLSSAPLGFDTRWGALVLATAALGAIVLWKRDRTETALVASPIIVALVLALAHRYPWADRLLLFLAFPLSVFLGVGIAALITQAGAFARGAWALPAGVFALAWAASLVAPLADARSSTGFKYHDVDGLLDSLAAEPKPRRLYFLHAAAIVARFHAERRPLDLDEVAISSVDLAGSPEDLATLAEEIRAFTRGGPAWVVLSHDDWTPWRIDHLVRSLDDLRLVENRQRRGAVALRFEPR